MTRHQGGASLAGTRRLIHTMLCIALLAACYPLPASIALQDQPESEPVPGLPVSTEANVRLLGGYWQIVLNDRGGKEQQANRMRYRPWQFDVGADLFFDESSTRWLVDDPGPYSGWDFLSTREHRHANVNYPAVDYLFLHLERQASIAVIWYGSPSSRPSWLQSWERGDDVTVNDTPRATFRTVLPAGEHYLGTTEGRNVQMYTVLLAEADGTPSPEPEWPAEWGDRIGPNTAIPRDHILHNIHFARGPDGHTYPTWHPQIDPTYWAYFEHDHGSDPSSFAGFPEVQPLWAYTDPSLADDRFFGFKVFVSDMTAHDGTLYSVMFTAHLDNLTRRRLCERFHTLDVAVAEKETGRIVLRTHMLADVGFPRDEGLETRVKPPECPGIIGILPDETRGRRNINKEPSPGAYESWQYDLAHAHAIPFVGSLAIQQEIPLTIMGREMDEDGNYTAERLVYGENPAMGTGRHFQFIGPSWGVDAREGDYGAFCTDVYARERVPCDASGALEQYIEPGLHIEFSDDARWGVDDPWVALYTPKTLEDRDAGQVINVWRNLEHAVRPAN